jgi:hypothetical protein
MDQQTVLADSKHELIHHTGKSEAITRAARNLGLIRKLTPDEIQANLASLENEVICHMQVSDAVNQMNWGW